MELSVNFPERPKTEIKNLEKTLGFLDKFFSDFNVEYRIFGSIIPAALLGKPQRKLGDIDLMMDAEDEGKLLREFRKAGYKVERRNFRLLALEMVWLEATGKELYDLTAFLGHFDKHKNFVIRVSNNLQVVASSEAVRATKYKFGSASFIGIPVEAAFYGAWASRSNPKRKYDLAAFRLKGKNKPPKYSVIDFYYKDKKLPFLYPISCFLQNVLGKISLSLGGNYDFWRHS